MTSQASKPRPKSTEEHTVDEMPAPVETSDIDDLIDEIDAVLEQDADTFVAEFIQKGGE